MKNNLVLLFFLALTVSVSAQSLPDRKETLEVMKKVNGYFMKKYADYTIPSFYGRVRPSNIWTRGVYYEGLMALYSIYPREDYYKYAYDWADFHKWGMRNGNTTRNADDHCCGQTYIDLYNICPSDPNMIRNIKASIDMVVNTPQVNDWWWIDAVQMAMPIFAKFGKMTGEQKYYDKMLQDLNLSYAQLPILIEIYENEGISLQQIVQVGGYDKGTVTKNVQKLNTLGYVSILTSAKDKRVKELYTTALTKKHISEIYGIRRDWWHHITQDLTAEQIEVFSTFYQTLSNHARSYADLEQTNLQFYKLKKLSFFQSLQQTMDSLS